MNQAKQAVLRNFVCSTMITYLFFPVFTTIILQEALTVMAEMTKHPCERPCEDGEGPRVCYYQFRIEWYYTLSKACHGCPRNITDCQRPHCVAADGIERAIVAVNRQIPGPSIEVCEGDEVIVDVQNHLGSEGTTIHWHGLHQMGSPFMDGVPLLTQCPINPHSTFRYRFEARERGTHFWHSHSGMQRSDGAAGTFVVRQTPRKDPHFGLYDHDLSEHIVMLTDWMHTVGIEMFASHHHATGDNKPTSVLINGKGQFPTKDGITNNRTLTPLEVFEVEHGQRYRFRLVSNGVLNCPLQFSIDNHTLLVIASDGVPIKPVEVDSLVIYAGERFDVVIQAHQPIARYWVKVQGLVDCDEKFTRASQAAVLHYHGADDTNPLGDTDYNSMDRGGKQLNPLNTGSTGQLMAVSDLFTLDPDDRTSEPVPDYKFYLAYDFNAVDNKNFYHNQLYPIYGIQKNQRLYTPQINDISLTFSPSPPLSQPEDLNPATVCNHTSPSGRNCTAEYCECVYMLSIPLQATVELIIIDKGYTFDANHPFHIHGHNFRVVAMDRVGQNVSLEEVQQLDLTGKIKRKLSGAVVKDSVTIPDGGYTVVRFVASNPGYWLLHCHISFHMEVGMAVILKIGEQADMPLPPKDFPKCGNWIPSEEKEASIQLNSASLPHMYTSPFTVSAIILINVIIQNVISELLATSTS